MSDFWNERTEHKARRAHRCIWCGEHIQVGEMYFYQSGRFNDDFQSNHWHHECWDAAAQDEDAFRDGFSPHENERPAAQVAIIERVA